MLIIKRLILAVFLLLATGIYSQNLLTNGDFESDFSGWNNLSENGSVVSYSLATGAEAYQGTNSMKVEVTTLGTNAWDIQSLKGGWGATTGKSYLITLWAKAAVAGQAFKVVQQINDTYSEKIFSLTTSYAQYTWAYTPAEDGVEFKFQFPNLGTFFIDNVEIIDPSAVIATGGNMIGNGNFELNFLNWQNLSTASLTGNTFEIITNDVAEGTKAMKVTVAEAGENAYDVQSIHSGWESDSGTTYTVSFYGKASVQGLKVRILQQNVTYDATDITLSTAYKKYTWTFTAKENGLMFRFNFPVAGTFYLDDVFIADPKPATVDTIDTAVVSINTQYQTMEGFGGALTWYSDWITYNGATHLDDFYAQAFDSMGIDILRIMNNYYPNEYLTDYPQNNIIDSLSAARKTSFNNSIEFANRAKLNNPDVQVLLCSWSPPAQLKSNDSLPMGGLKKNGDAFMYSEYARYWEDVLKAYKSSGFVPDYVSIQNEPGYQNKGWETCEFRPTETAEYASYTTAFDSVYNRISKLPDVPKLIGPEVENIGNDSDLGGTNTFTGYSSPLVGKNSLSAYAYHLYNYSGNGESAIMSDATAKALAVVKDYNDKPNFMTEFGSLDWFTNALMIHQTITKANAAAYIHWELAWEDNDFTAIALTTSGTFTIKPMYYTLKHFAKFIDKGYVRIDVTNSNKMIAASGYKNPDKNQITLVLINRDTKAVTYTAGFPNLVTASKAFTSTANDKFIPLSVRNKTVKLPARSITTLVIDYSDEMEVTQNINLSAGWNLISTNVHVADSSIESVFSGLNVEVVKTTDSYWSKGQSTVLNSLKTIEAGKGYLIKMNAAGILSNAGKPININKYSFTIQNGWNLIGVPYRSSTTFSNYFNTNNCSVIKNFEGFWEPVGKKNSIQNIEPGKGYFLKK
ncbi:MAG: carbohydrate binding domain-containing protein [Bacteroidales bacterium]|nr:carbohydrate binding domain-containing protein [Bacteroidales bacterium]